MMSVGKNFSWLNLSTLLMTAAGMVFLGIGVHKRLAFINRYEQGTLLSIHRRALLSQSDGWESSGLLGSPTAPFALVEFGDYQCPACRALNDEMRPFLNKESHNLSFRFRNLPLVALHPHAMDAAILAEEFRHSPSFWRVHDQIMRLNMNYPNMQMDFNRISKENVVRISSLAQQKNAAIHAVNNDTNDAKDLGLNYTPSLLLCCPDGKVYLVQGISQIKWHINGTSLWQLFEPSVMNN